MKSSPWNFIPGCLLAFALPFSFAEESAVESAESPPVALQTGDWNDLREYVAEQSGRIVVVDIWSTSCIPCMKEFPGLVQLATDHPDQVVSVSFCVDYAGIKSRPPERYRERVEKFLTKQNATFRNYLCTTPSDEFFEEIKLGSIPAVIVYGRDGMPAKRFDSTLLEDGEEEAFTYKDDINPFIEQLLSNAPAATSAK